MSRVIKDSKDKKIHIGMDCHAKNEIDDLKDTLKKYPKEKYDET
jgi:hypothetical protein